MSDKELYSGMVRLHIIYHASKGPIFGLWIIEELGRHGYKLSPGTLYPILHALERKGYLRSTGKRKGRQARRMYRATPAGRKALAVAKIKVRELVGELFED
jgi:PadR family transcriptional regulator, regulatory protein PadR